MARCTSLYGDLPDGISTHQDAMNKEEGWVPGGVGGWVWGNGGVGGVLRSQFFLAKAKAAERDIFG